MAVISNLGAQPQAGDTQPAKRIPSYMRPTKTSARKAGIEDQGPGSVSKQRDGNQAQRVPLKPVPGVKAIEGKATLDRGKEKQVIKSGSVVSIKPTSSKPQTNKSVHSTSVIVSQKASPEEPGEKTLGKLFTDGGLEDILIRVLEMLVPKDMAKCLNVCKNTNEVMFKTSFIQLGLRYRLYGLRIAPYWHHHMFRKETSVQSIDRIISLHHKRTSFRVGQSSANPITIRNGNHGAHRGRMMVVTDRNRRWAVFDNLVKGSFNTRLDSLKSLLELCSVDRVVVEHVIRYNSESTPIMEARFHAIRPSSDQSQDSVKHSDAKFHTVSLHLPKPDPCQPDVHYQLRLHPGGLAAVLLYSEMYWPNLVLPLRGDTSIPLVVFNWHRGTGLGVIKVPKRTVVIHDFQFLNDTQIVCCSSRSKMLSGRPFPVIDVYDIPKGFESPVTADIDLRHLPVLNHVASFRFPPLADNRDPSQPKNAHIFDMSIERGQPSESTGIFDQMLAFRLDGDFDNKEETIQGVISISRLQDIMLDDVGKKGRPLRIDWTRWLSAVSLEKSTSSALVPQPKNTLVAKLARSQDDPARAVIILRDYNQQLLYAPSNHMNRRLGRSMPGNDTINQNKFDDSASPFEVVKETKLIKTAVFEDGSIEYGLGHRIRKIDMGKYSPNTARSKIYWYEDLLWILPGTENNPIYPYTLWP